jgi:hypothetical protein
MTHPHVTPRPRPIGSTTPGHRPPAGRCTWGVALSLGLAATLPARAEPTDPPRLGRVALEQWVRAIGTSTRGTTLRALAIGRADVGFVGDVRPGAALSRFDLGRLEATLAVAAAPHGFAVVTLETVRSSGPTSAFGVDGDALVVRARHAYAQLRPTLGPAQLELAAGLVPDLYVRALELSFPVRGLGPAAPERSGVLGASDLGGNLGVEAWDGRVRLVAQLANGEGRSQVEQNPGKNLALLLYAEPLRADLLGHPASLELAVFFRDGSVGPASGREHRLGGFVSLTLDRGALGATWVEAYGYRGRPELEARSVGAWLCATIWPRWLTLFGRLDVLDRDRAAADATATTAWLGVLSDLVDARDTHLGLRARAFLAYQRERFGAAATAAPGATATSDADRIFGGLELVGMGGTTLEPPGAAVLGP